MLGGPLLPILLLAIPVAMAVIVLVAGVVSWLRPSTLARAIVVAPQKARTKR